MQIFRGNILTNVFFPSLKFGQWIRNNGIVDAVLKWRLTKKVTLKLRVARFCLLELVDDAEKAHWCFLLKGTHVR